MGFVETAGETRLAIRAKEGCGSSATKILGSRKIPGLLRKVP